MIRLKHKQTGKEWYYSATVWFNKGYNIKDYEILEWNDVVELFSGLESMGKMEKRDAINRIDNSPYLALHFKDVLKPSDYPSGKEIVEAVKREIAENKTPEAQNYNRLRRLPKSKLVLNTIKKAVPVLTKTGNKVLRWLSAFSIAFLSGLLLIDHNYIKFWDWLKNIF